VCGVERDDEEVPKPISAILREFCADPDGEMTLGEIVHRLGRRAFGAILFLFSTPNLLPLPPGSSTVLGAPLVLLAPQVALGVRAPWLPRRLAERRFKTQVLASFAQRVLPWLERIERVSRPRLTFFFGSVGDRLIGLVCSLLAVVLIFPIPFGNMLPAASIGVLSLSLVQRDGILAILGYVLAAASAGVLTLAAQIVLHGVQQLLSFFGAA
jgi:hypothetical protein